MSTSEIGLALIAAAAVGAAVNAAPAAILPTLALIVLIASIAWLATYQRNPLNALVDAYQESSCDARDPTCPSSRCAIQTIDNPFGNPGVAEYGTADVYASNCKIDRAKALMKARPGFGGVAFADDSRFHKVPALDDTDWRQWLYAIPPNCKHTQAACAPRPTLIDAVRRSDLTGSFADYI